MKRNPGQTAGSEAPDGHHITEVVGLTATNTSRYSVAYIVAPAGNTGTPRRNQFDEILIIEEGHGAVVQDHSRENVGPRDVVLLPAGTRYWIEASTDLHCWALCVPAFRPEWSQTGEARRDWRDFQSPRGTDRLRFGSDDS